MKINKLEQWDEVFQDVEFAKKLVTMPMEEAMAELNNKGYDFTAQDMEQMGSFLKKCAEKISADGELPPELLEQVSGGGHVGSFLAGFAVAGGIGGAGLLICFALW